MNISLRAPEKGPNKAENGVLTMKKNFQWPERFYSVDWDEKWVFMQNSRNLGQKTAELALGGFGYPKCLLLPSELFRAVFLRRLPFKSFDTLHVNMLLREHVPSSKRSRPWKAVNRSTSEQVAIYKRSSLGPQRA